jgi:hypothetical protein
MWRAVVRLWPGRLHLPLRRKKPTRYFVNSMEGEVDPDLIERFTREL